ncbi:hypothetical protein Dsin_013201 [Dipteronia sinensis]|uniref:Uncharacterized protein n=1 Tax=Dipteronia sinensis TaxID=43782 RepID=A0AAE0E8S1_9ROSI|nr:hypothetical protein Dsin_013201 [Dipteronia sinensis]
MHKETGIGWDPAKKTVDAPPEWWQSKIEMNVEYRKFRVVGISPDMMNMYDTMFKGSTSVGVVGWSKGKNGKLGGAAKLSKQIDRLVEVVESRSRATSMHRSSQGTSIAKVMEAVTTLPGAEKGSQLWWFATELFCSQEKREMFSIMTDSDLKLQFLILNQNKARN